MASRLLFSAWLAGVFVIVTSLATAHWVALPAPRPNHARLSAALSTQAAARSWSLSHVLYGQCACSRRVLEHLRTRGALPDTFEQVILAGALPGQETPLRERGFSVQVVKPTELKTRFGLECAPMLIVAQPGGAIRYVGGYSERKQGPVLREREILAALRQGDERASLPLFGCAVSRSLQRMLDPLGLKYAKD